MIHTPTCSASEQSTHLANLQLPGDRNILQPTEMGAELMNLIPDSPYILPAHPTTPLIFHNYNMAKHVVFDIEGTIVSHDRLSHAIETRLGARLRAAGILTTPKFLVFTWFEVAEREYTYASIIGTYLPYIKVCRAVFYRILFMAGIADPRSFVSEEDLDYLMEEYANLEVRDGAKECIQILRDGGFTVWAFTCADRGQVKGYFDKAGIEMAWENVLHCDGKGLAKPELSLYKELMENEFQGGRVWFAAAHGWDAAGARQAG